MYVQSSAFNNLYSQVMIVMMTKQQRIKALNTLFPLGKIDDII